MSLMQPLIGSSSYQLRSTMAEMVLRRNPFEATNAFLALLRLSVLVVLVFFCQLAPPLTLFLQLLLQFVTPKLIHA